jgi:predicted acyltransferase (DUF342 family)
MEGRADMNADFAAKFREQVAGWLLQLGPLKHGEKVRTLNLGSRRLLVAEALVCPPGYALADVLVVLGDLHAGPGCWFAGPVLVGGACEVGAGSRIMALAAGTRLTLGDRCEVSDWVDSHGPLALGSGSRIRGGAASRHSIQLGAESEVTAMFGPAIATPNFSAGAALPEMRERPVEVLPPGAGTGEFPGGAGFQRARLSALGKDTWAYDGTLRFDRPVILKSKLVIRGSFHCAAASLLEGGVKAGGDVSIGAHSILNGQVTARGDLTLGVNCLFSGDLSAGVELRLAAGTRGFRDGAPVALTSGAAMHWEDNVLVRGEVHSGAGIRQQSAASARESYLALANA